jgi:hypothetical protein
LRGRKKSRPSEGRGLRDQSAEADTRGPPQPQAPACQVLRLERNFRTSGPLPNTRRNDSPLIPFAGLLTKRAAVTSRAEQYRQLARNCRSLARSLPPERAAFHARDGRAPRISGVRLLICQAVSLGRRRTSRRHFSGGGAPTRIKRHASIASARWASWS